MDRNFTRWASVWGPKKKKKVKRSTTNVNKNYDTRLKYKPGMGKEFYSTNEWLQLRYKILKRDGRKCACCGASSINVVFHVDHIKPRSLFPELELFQDNLQVLCEDCNLGKSNLDMTNWNLANKKVLYVVGKDGKRRKIT
jgi:5-methylcytosine-specific restriction endonuclease McrA